MTQSLIGAESNERMKCAVFRISGKSCRKRWLYRRCVFFPCMTAQSPHWQCAKICRFQSKAFCAQKNYIKRIAASNGKIVWFRTEKSVFAVRLIKNRETSQTLGALCFTVNTQNIERFLCAGKCCCRLALIDDKGLCVCTFGRGGEGSVFRKTNSVDGRGAVFPLCGVFSYLHL